MTIKHFKHRFPKFIFFVFAWLLPLAANCAQEEAINEKRVSVAMRTIGHDVLMSLGDCESRVLPIEKIGDQYKIPFELEFGFDPGDIVSIVDVVMSESRIATNYLVEVQQCKTKEVMHSFEVSHTTNLGSIACRGRFLPTDCYSLLITILDGAGPEANLLTSTSEGPFMTPSETKKASPFKSALLIVPTIFLFGFVGYYIKKKNSVDTDPNLILIGASRFDKRNMALSIENQKVALSNKESDLLSLLHTSANVPVAREVILQRVWGDEGAYVGRTLDVFISKLRKKLEPDTSVKIVNIRGVGYKLVMNVPG